MSSRSKDRRRSFTAAVAGALASTRACQRIIVRALGRDGVDFVRALRTCVELHAKSSSVAKKFKSDVFKLLAQWIVYEREGRFSGSQISSLQKPAMRVTLMIVVALHQHLKLDHMRSMGATTARNYRRDSTGADDTSTRVRATRAKLEWMKYRLGKVDDTLQQLSLSQTKAAAATTAAAASSAASDDASSTESKPKAYKAEKDENARGNSSSDSNPGVEKIDLSSALRTAAPQSKADPVDQIIEMEDALESLAVSLTSIRSDTSLWSELLTEGPPNAETLGASIKEFGTAFHAVLTPLLDGTDKQRLEEMIEFASSHGFLSDILTKDNFFEHRKVLYRTLTRKDTSFGIPNPAMPAPFSARGRAPPGTYSGKKVSPPNSSAATPKASSGDSSSDTKHQRKRSIFGHSRTRSNSLLGLGLGLTEIDEVSSDDSSASSTSL